MISSVCWDTVNVGINLDPDLLLLIMIPHHTDATTMNIACPLKITRAL